jgi:hypothetical protein
VQRARYQAFPDKFIVQFTDVDTYSPSGSHLTFQVILFPNGTILYQYLTMTGTLNSATIGIQDATRTIGLTVAHNVNYIHNNMAIRIQASPDWLSAAPLSGVIPAGGQKIVNVNFNATDLFGGLYEGGLNITTDDPLAHLEPATLGQRDRLRGGVSGVSQSPAGPSVQLRNRRPDHHRGEHEQRGL